MTISSKTYRWLEWLVKQIPATKNYKKTAPKVETEREQEMGQRTSEENLQLRCSLPYLIAISDKPKVLYDRLIFISSCQ